MAGEKFMLPYTVTDVHEMDIVRNMEYPRLAACIPKGIRFLVTSTEALYWDDCKECLVPVINSTVYAELFFPIAYLCERYSCTISGVIKPKKLKEDWFIYKMMEKRGAPNLTLSDVNIYLTDLEDKGVTNAKFEKRLELLESVCGDIGDMNIEVAPFKQVKDFTDLAVLINKSLNANKNNTVLVRSKESIIYDNTGFFHTASFSTYCSYFELGCNMHFKAKLTDVLDKSYNTKQSDLYKDEDINIATFFMADYKKSKVKVSLFNMLTNFNKSSILTIRNLWLKNKDKLIDKEIIFTAFAFTSNEDEVPIGAAFLKFNKV